MKRKKVAITGIKNSGKTSFLTSLLWQLNEIGEADFDIGEDTKISNFREAPSDVDSYHYRKIMVREQRWPRKTIDIQRFRCQFDRNSKGVRHDPAAPGGARRR